MEINFDSLHKHVIRIQDFALSWRFTDEKYCKLSQEDLDELKPLDEQAARFINNRIKHIHQDMPFTNGLFSNINTIEINDNNDLEVAIWLGGLGLSNNQNVYLTWNTSTGMVVPFRLIVKYFNEFYYPSSDDLTVVGDDLNWALLFFHTNEIYFGTK